MKPTLLFNSFIIFLTSCNQFNYLTVSGRNVSKTESHQLVSENDTLSVAYDFSGEAGKVAVKIFNKTDELIEIDWKKSAVIVGDKGISYYNPEIRFTGRIENDTLTQRQTYQTYGSPAYLADIKANILISEPSQFIFPKTYLVKASPSFQMSNRLPALDNLQKGDGEKVQLSLGSYTSVSYRKIQFPVEKSPLVIRSFLTFRMGKAGSQKEFSMEHSFYVSEVWRSSSSPQEFPDGLLNRADRLAF